MIFNWNLLFITENYPKAVDKREEQSERGMAKLCSDRSRRGAIKIIHIRDGNRYDYGDDGPFNPDTMNPFRRLATQVSW